MTVPYGRLLSRPGTAAFVAAGFAARLGHLMTALATIFLIAATTRSYSLAGGVAAAYVLSYSLLSPLVSRLADEHGQHAVLLAAAVGGGLCRAGFLGAVHARTPTWSLFALSAATGAAMPAVGAMVRARWVYLLHDSPLLEAGLSVESVIDDLILVTGPAAVALLTSYVEPDAGLIMCLVLTTGGQVALGLQRRTEPPPARAAAGARRGTSLTTPGFPWLIAAFAAMGAAQATVDLAVIACCGAHGMKALSGGVLAVLAVASMLAGLSYGSRQWKSPAERRLLITLALFAVFSLPLIATPAVWFLFPGILLFGATGGPVMISSFSAITRSLPAHLRTEGLTFVTTAVGLGVAAGSALGGKITDGWGWRAAFIFAACCAVATLLPGVAFVYLPRRAASAQPSPSGPSPSGPSPSGAASSPRS